MDNDPPSHTHSNAAAHADDEVDLSRHAHEIYGLLHLAFVIAPVVAGLDRFFQLLTDWDKYVAPAAISMSRSATRGCVSLRSRWRG
jgi:hypothetical protein